MKSLKEKLVLFKKFKDGGYKVGFYLGNSSYTLAEIVQRIKFIRVKLAKNDFGVMEDGHGIAWKKDGIYITFLSGSGNWEQFEKRGK